MYFLVSGQITFSRKLFVTCITLESLNNIFMYIHVLSQAPFCRECLVACFTDKRSFPCMLSGMNNQFMFCHPPPITCIALKALLPLHACMCDHVSSEAATIRCCEVALITLVRTFHRVLTPDVNSQVTFLRKPSITHLTGEWFLLCVCSLVYGKIIAVCSRVIAASAFEWPFFSCTMF